MIYMHLSTIPFPPMSSNDAETNEPSLPASLRATDTLVLQLDGLDLVPVPRIPRRNDAVLLSVAGRLMCSSERTRVLTKSSVARHISKRLG